MDQPSTAPPIEIATELPPVRLAGDAIRTVLADNPGQYARIMSGVTRGQATGRASAINRGHGRWAPRGRYAASIRQDDSDDADTWSVWAVLIDDTFKAPK